MLRDTSSLLSEQCLPERPSLLENMSRKINLVMEDFYLVFAVELVPTLYLKVLKLSNSCPSQYLSLKDVYSSPTGPSAR